MPIYKRPDSRYWWARFRVAGRRIQQSTGTADRQEAQRIHDQLKAEAWRLAEQRETGDYRWQDAVKRFLAETQHKRSRDLDILRLRWLDPYLYDIPLQDISRDRVEDILRPQEKKSAASYNRYIALIRSILRKASQEWGWIDRSPLFRQVREEPRVRWITQQEARDLLRALPDYLEGPARFALATGMRKSNLFGLRWDQIDLQRRVAWVDAVRTKNRRGLHVPLGEDALAALRAQRGKHESAVFTRRGKPFKGNCATAWKKACAAAGIEDFRWHDLRHTWASWQVQAGTPIQVLMELGGWSDLKMVLRYAHLGQSHLSQYADAVRLGGTFGATGDGKKPLKSVK